MLVKYCPKCQTYRNLSAFSLCSARKDGLQLWCNPCGKVNKNMHYHKGRKRKVCEQARKYQLKRNYGLSLKAYNNLRNKQKGVCAICGKPETQRSNPKGKVDSLRVDHCHKTNRIRGLLCSKCNFGIAQFNDSLDLLEKAKQYLRKDQQ